MSQRGAAYELFMLTDTGQFENNISIPLILEYGDVAKQLIGSKIRLSKESIDNIIDYICLEARHRDIYYLWRPFLKDAKDDMVLELAVRAGCK